MTSRKPSQKDRRPCRKCGQSFSSKIEKCPRCFPPLQVSLTQAPLNSQNIAFASNCLSAKSQRASSRLLGRGIVLLVFGFFLVGYFLSLSGWALVIWVSVAVLVLLVYGCSAHFGPYLFYGRLFTLDRTRGVADILQARVERKWRVPPSGGGISFISSLFSFISGVNQVAGIAESTHETDEEKTMHEEASEYELVAETLGDEDEENQYESQNEVKPGGFWDLTSSEQEIWEKSHPDHFDYYIKVGGRNFKTEVFAWYRVAERDWVWVRFMRHSDVVLTVTRITEADSSSIYSPFKYL